MPIEVNHETCEYKVSNVSFTAIARCALPVLVDAFKTARYALM